MSNIFISYRREDSAGHSGRLFDRLGEHFGKDHVFMDIAGLEPGVDFVEAIENALGSCDAFIVVIGKQWLSITDAEGRRRLDNPEDFIRLELATALRRNIRTIPVLVQGAAAPSSRNLPGDLKKLSRLQAHEISDNRWDYDVRTLVQTLEKVLKKELTKGKKTVEDEAQPIPPPPPSKFPRWVIAVLAAIVIAVGIYAIWPLKPPAIKVPNVMGESFEKAKFILEQKGLKGVMGGQQPIRERPPGTVLGQDPKPGQEAKQGQKVFLVLAARPVIEMPDVVGKRIEEAMAIMKEVGLAVPGVKEVKTREKSPGIVLNQNPKARTRVEPGQKVHLEVAVRPSIEMPNVVGESFEKAKFILEQNGLKVVMGGQQPIRERPPGTVLGQDPKPGQEAKQGQKVFLLVAVRPIIEMPNVVGKRIEEARAIIREAGLALPGVKEIKTREKSPGIVLNQNPKARTRVEPDQKVHLEVAVRDVIEMPNVLGVQFDKAKAILTERGLKVSRIEKPTGEKPPGTVLEQNPRQGREVEKGQRVELVVAQLKPIPPPKPLPPRIHSFEADRSDVLYGQSSTLHWTTSNSVLIRLANSRGWSLQFSEKSGMYSVTPTSSETYVLIAEGEGGLRIQQTVQINVRVPCKGLTVRRTFLRNRPGAFTMEQIRGMILQRGFRESDWNPNGDFHNVYEVYEQVVVDCATGLMWQRSGSEAKEWEWQTAPTYIRRINAERFAGFSDWRLPTIEELASLLEPRRNSKGLYINEVFDNRDQFWSPDDWIPTYGTPCAWGAKFDFGGVFQGGAKTNRFFVRGVRSLR